MATVAPEQSVHRLNLRLAQSTRADLATLAKVLNAPESVVGRAALQLGLIALLRDLKPANYRTDAKQQLLVEENTAITAWSRNKAAGRG